MNMKLSYRDKVVFIVVIVIIILVAGFFLFIKPKFEEIDTAKLNLEQVQAKKDEIDAKIASLPGVIDAIKKTAQEVGDLQERFFDEQDPYLNEIYIREALSSYNMDYLEINTEYAIAADINKYTVDPLHVLAYDNKISADLYNELPQEVYDLYNKVASPTYPGAMIGVTRMNMGFSSELDFRTAYNVINRIAEDEKTVVLNNIIFDKDNVQENQHDLSCNITLYSVYPLNVEKALEETTDIKPIETPAETAAE